MKLAINEANLLVSNINNIRDRQKTKNEEIQHKTHFEQFHSDSARNKLQE